MPTTIQIRCNGEGRHINTVNIQELLDENVIVYRGAPSPHKEIPEKLVRRCAECPAQIIITKQMINENLGLEGRKHA